MDHKTSTLGFQSVSWALILFESGPIKTPLCLRKEQACKQTNSKLHVFEYFNVSVHTGSYLSKGILFLERETPEVNDQAIVEG